MKYGKIIWPMLAAALLCGAAAAFVLLPGYQVDAECIGGIPTPEGFHRGEAEEGSYTAFLRALPLKEAGSRVHLYTKEEAPFQWISSGVVDWKMISEFEQCADVTMRIRAEYFWKTGQFDRLRFTDVRGNEHVFEGKQTRRQFNAFLKDVYKTCNTASLYDETLPREIRDAQPGDVLVYSSRREGAYGHAVLVADVARDYRGRVAILCVEGNTPAREIHIVRNLNRFRNPWFILNGNERTIRLSVSWFERDELRHYPEE